MQPRHSITAGRTSKPSACLMHAPNSARFSAWLLEHRPQAQYLAVWGAVRVPRRSSDESRVRRWRATYQVARRRPATKFIHTHPDLQRDPIRDAERAFDRLNPNYGVPANQHNRYGAKPSMTGKPPWTSGCGWPSMTAARTTGIQSSGSPARTTAWPRPSTPPVTSPPGPAVGRSEVGASLKWGHRQGRTCSGPRQRRADSGPGAAGETRWRLQERSADLLNAVGALEVCSRRAPGCRQIAPQTPLPPSGWLKNGCAVLPAPDREWLNSASVCQIQSLGLELIAIRQLPASAHEVPAEPEHQPPAP
jgi:hypothetical protein